MRTVPPSGLDRARCVVAYTTSIMCCRPPWGIGGGPPRSWGGPPAWFVSGWAARASPHGEPGGLGFLAEGLLPVGVPVGLGRLEFGQEPLGVRVGGGPDGHAPATAGSGAAGG